VTAPKLHRVTTLDLRVTPYAWPFAAARRAEISAHFAEVRRAKPKLWNGKVLIARNPRFAGDGFSADYFEVDFASFLAWRDLGFPDREVFNGFGMGALRSSDGAFVLGEMGADTANAGRIYFPSGTPDLSDIKDGTMDIAGSVAREVEEETGISPADYRAAPSWTCVEAGASIAMMRILDVDMPAEALRASIVANLARQSAPELAALHLVRARADFSSAMPRFVTAFLEAELAS